MVHPTKRVHGDAAKMGRFGTVIMPRGSYLLHKRVSCQIVWTVPLTWKDAS